MSYGREVQSLERRTLLNFHDYETFLQFFSHTLIHVVAKFDQ